MLKTTCADCLHHFCRMECVNNGIEKKCIGSTCKLKKGYAMACFNKICKKFVRL